MNSAKLKKEICLGMTAAVVVVRQHHSILVLCCCCSLRGFQPKKHLKREMFSDFLCTTYVLITYCAAAVAAATNSLLFQMGMLRRLVELHPMNTSGLPIEMNFPDGLI